MSAGSDPPNTPRAVVHKQVLDAAKRRPAASLEALADEVSGASTELVEKTLEEYGDPADPTPAAGGSPASDGHTTGGAPPAEGGDSAVEGPDSLGMSETSDAASGTPEGAIGTDHPSGDGQACGNGRGSGTDDGRGTGRQDSRGRGDPDGAPEIPPRTRETLRLVCVDPGASQADLANRMGVVKSAINKWLHALEGFEWERREEFAARHVDCDAARAGDRAPRGGDDRREAGRPAPSGGVVTVPADLAPEVVYASLSSGRLTDDEALRLLESVVDGGR